MIALATNVIKNKNGKIIRRKQYAITLQSDIVSIHSSHQACISQMKYLKSNDVIFSKARPPKYTYEQVSLMRIAYKPEGYTNEPIIKTTT